MIALVMSNNKNTVKSTEVGRSEQYLLEVVKHLLGRHSKERLFEKTKHDIQALVKDLDEINKMNHQTQSIDEKIESKETVKKSVSSLTDEITSILRDLGDVKDSSDNSIKKHNKKLQNSLNDYEGQPFDYHNTNMNSGKSNLKDDAALSSSDARKSAELLAKYFRFGDETEKTVK